MSRQFCRPVSYLLLVLILISLPASVLAAPSAPEITLPLIQVSAGLENNTTPTIARAPDGRVWVAWQSVLSAGEVVRGRYTTDSGATWSDEIQLTDDIELSYEPALAASADGTLWLVYTSESAGPKDIWYRTSTDSGDTWAGPLPLTADDNMDVEPGIGVTGDSSLVVAWRSLREGTDDIWYRRTTDGGANWSAEAQLTTHPSSDTMPTLAKAPNGNLWAVWEREGELFRRFSTDGGANWYPESSMLGVYSSEYSPALAVGGTTMWLFSACDGDICYRSSANSGTSWSGYTEISSYVQPDGGASAGVWSETEVAVVWESVRNIYGTSDVYLGIPGVRVDENPPLVDYSSRTPAGNPITGQTVSIRCRALDETSVAGVNVVWTKGGLPQTNLSMLDNGSPPDTVAGDSFFNVSFPALASSDLVEYHFVGTDGAGHSTPTPSFSFTVLPPFTKSADILLVMDQVSQDNSEPLPRYQAALDATGLAYDVWDSGLRGPIDSALLPQYLPGGTVVWAAPDVIAYLSDSDPSQRDALHAFLAGGGNAFISGQDVSGGLYDFDNSFLENDLFVHHSQRDIGPYPAEGVDADPISQSLGFDLESDGPLSQALGDEVDPLTPAELFLTWSGFVPSMTATGAASPSHVNTTGGAGIHVDTGDYKVVFLSFGLEGVVDAGTRAALLGRSLGWMGECTVPQPPAGLAVTVESADLLLAWHDTAGEQHELWYSTADPYFTPGANCTGPSCTAQRETALRHVGVAADPANDHFYTVHSVGSCGAVSGASSRVGNMTFGLVSGS